VGHARSHRPEFGDALGFSQLFLQALPFADIPQHDQDRRTFLIHKSRRADFCVHGSSAQRDNLLLEHGHLRTAFHQLMDALSNRRVIIRMEQVRNRSAQDLISLHGAEQFDRLVVGEENAVASNHHNGVGRNGDQTPVALFALPQQVLGPLPFRDVGDEPFQVAQATVRGVNPFTPLPDRLDLPRPGEDPIGRFVRATLRHRCLNLLPYSLPVTRMGIVAIRDGSLYEVFLDGVPG